MAVLAFLKLLGCLGLLLYGTKLMSESLERMAGDHLRHVLDSLTTNRFMSLITGALVTVCIQSSTTASLMTISFVHAGMLSIVQALPILMGASVGNTLIAWIMAAECNFGISNYILPLMLVAFFLVYYRRWKSLGEAFFGLCFILFSLGLLCNLAGDMELTYHAQMMHYLGVVNETYLQYALLLLIGACVTFMVQSSAVLMATSMILCSTGVWSIYSGVAFVLGENIGRAVATLRAASSAGTDARRTAFGQMVFNFVGVAWMFFAFPYAVDGLFRLIDYKPATFPLVTDSNLAYVIAAFHTGFNLINAGLFIGLVKPLERLAAQVVTKTLDTRTIDGELRFISKGQMETPQLSLMEAQKEIVNFADMASKMFLQTRYLFSTYSTNEFKNILALIEHYEENCDEMEDAIANYLNKIEVPDEDRVTKQRICRMMRMVAEVEHIADSCLNIAHIARRNLRNTQKLTDVQKEHIHQMFQLVEQSLDQMKQLLSVRKRMKDQSVSFYIENEINKYRSQLREQNFSDIYKGDYTYATGALYMHVINECERMADCVMHVAESSVEVS